MKHYLPKKVADWIWLLRHSWLSLPQILFISSASAEKGKGRGQAGVGGFNRPGLEVKHIISPRVPLARKQVYDNTQLPKRLRNA